MTKDISSEAEHFDTRDMADRRRVSWSRLAAPYVKQALYGDSDRLKFLSELGKRHKPGLALACGDMKAEAKYFKLLESSEVDGYDVSAKSLERAKQHCAELGLKKVNLVLGDANKVKLPKNYYGLVVLAHAYHHLEDIDQIAEEIAGSLLPNGIFLLLDYVGPKNLQFTPQQLKHANVFFKKIPAELRLDVSGKFMERVHPPLRWGLSVHEAVQSPKILPAIEENFTCIKGLLYGGLMHPTLERIAGSFDQTKPAHKKILEELWSQENKLMKNKELEPNFCELFLVRKDSELTKKYPAQHFAYRNLETDERYEWLVDTSSREIWRLKKNSRSS